MVASTAASVTGLGGISTAALTAVAVLTNANIFLMVVVGVVGVLVRWAMWRLLVVASAAAAAAPIAAALALEVVAAVDELWFLLRVVVVLPILMMLALQLTAATERGWKTSLQTSERKWQIYADFYFLFIFIFWSLCV